MKVEARALNPKASRWAQTLGPQSLGLSGVEIGSSFAWKVSAGVLNLKLHGLGLLGPGAQCF